MPIARHSDASSEKSAQLQLADHTDAGIAAEALNLAELSGKSFVYSALQGPVDGLTEVVNHVTASKILPRLKLVEPPEQQPFGSKEWLATTVGSGFGMVAPFLLVKGSSAKALTQLGRLGETSEIGAALVRTISLSQAEATSVGRLANTVRFVAPSAKMALDGAVYGSLHTEFRLEQRFLGAKRHCRSKLSDDLWHYGPSQPQYDGRGRKQLKNSHF